MYVYIYLTFLNPFISFKLFTIFMLYFLYEQDCNECLDRCLFEYWFSFSFGSISRSGYGGLHVVIFLIFWGTLLSFYNNPLQFILRQYTKRCFFLHILTSICYLFLFDSRHPNKCEMATHHSFCLHFPWGLVVLNLSIQEKKENLKKIEIFWMG